MKRDEILKSMTPRDLLLGDQTDVNEVSTLLGKVRVFTCEPSSTKSVDGAFRCQYQFVTQEPSSRNPRGTINITPNEEIAEEPSEPEVETAPEAGEPGAPEAPDAPEVPEEKQEAPQEQKEEEEKEEEQQVKEEQKEEERQVEEELKAEEQKEECTVELFGVEEHVDKKAKIDQESGEVVIEEAEKELVVSSEEPVESKLKNGSNNEASSSESMVEDPDDEEEKKTPMGEGSTEGVIHVGSQHQTSIPEQVGKEKYIPLRSTPAQMVWKPQSNNDASIDKFMEEAAKALHDYAKKEGMHLSRKKVDISDLLGDEGKKKMRHEDIFSKDMDRDAILALLHDEKYDTTAALKALCASPERYLNLWSPREKEYFNAGFERHYNNLRLVTKAMAEQKNHKDVVDYHYRYKIPDQFVHYKETKREQARLMLEIIEKRRAEEMTKTKKQKTDPDAATTRRAAAATW